MASEESTLEDQRQDREDEDMGGKESHERLSRSLVGKDDLALDGVFQQQLLGPGRLHGGLMREAKAPAESSGRGLVC